MLKKIILSALFAILSLGLYCQRPTMEITFTAVDNTTYVELDSIKIMNRTQGGDTLLYWPDTVLSVYYIGIPEIPKNHNGFLVSQNYPNPVANQTTVSLYVPGKDNVSIMVTDILGRMLIKSERELDRGKHTFQFTPGNENLCFFTASWQGQSSSIVILQAGLNSGGSISLEYTSGEDSSPQLKALQAIQSFFFTPGDELLCIGYANGFESGMLDSPGENTTYTFQFATNIPCPDMPTVEYEGQVYSTIQIFSQCWLKENLNVGEMIHATIEQTHNGTLEKYCYSNEPDSCNKYGGLYQWDEMMQYTTQPGVRGICPPGWHLPADDEWKVLEGAVDSQYGIGDPKWDIWDYRGLDAGMNLKTTAGWLENGNGTDLFGFSGLPDGYRYGYGSFYGIGIYGYWWTSKEYDNDHAWGRYHSCYSPGAGRGFNYKKDGFSVRCLWDKL